MADWIATVRKRELVDVAEIKKSYLISELSKAVNAKGGRSSFEEKLRDFLNRLESGELDGLTKLISSDYRKNAVYRHLGECSEWHKIEAHIDSIYLTKTNEKENMALATLSPPCNLGSLVKRIRTSDREDLVKDGLGDFVGKGDLTKELPIAVYRNENEVVRIELIDGMHRTPGLFIGNEETYLTLYVGRND